MHRHKRPRGLAVLLGSTLLLSAMSMRTATAQARSSANDYTVNSAWRASERITSRYTSREAGAEEAYKKAVADIGNVQVTAVFEKTAERDSGASYLLNRGMHHSANRATAAMFHAEPDPSGMPALGLYMQPSTGNGGALDSSEKKNFNGRAEVGILTLRFSEQVSNPILDISALGGYSYAQAFYDDGKGGGYDLARGSFNNTHIEIATEGIHFKALSEGVNLRVEDQYIEVREKNTFNHSTYNGERIGKGSYIAPKFVPAGAGSVMLAGRFDTVRLRLIHEAIPFSEFKDPQYDTGRAYFTRDQKDRPNFGDGINGFNVINPELTTIGKQTFTGRQNADLFRLSIRLQKPSSIGDTIWLDGNHDGIQNAGEEGLDGLLVTLLDEDGQPATDIHGVRVPVEVTKNGGKYLFENLAAGNYRVQFEKRKDLRFVPQSQGDKRELDSDVSPETGITDVIALEANRHRSDIDAGLERIYFGNVIHISEDGQVLEPLNYVRRNAPEGENYTTEQRSFKGYTFLRMDSKSAPENGKVKREDQHIVYVYRKLPEPTPTPEPMLTPAAKHTPTTEPTPTPTPTSEPTPTHESMPTPTPTPMPVPSTEQTSPSTPNTTGPSVGAERKPVPTTSQTQPTTAGSRQALPETGETTSAFPIALASCGIGAALLLVLKHRTRKANQLHD